MTTRILVVDNYDSFVWTIAGYLAQLGAECDVLRNDAVSAADAGDYDGLLLSPGPGVPSAARLSPDMVRCWAATGCSRTGSRSVGTATPSPARSVWRRSCAAEAPRTGGSPASRPEPGAPSGGVSWTVTPAGRRRQLNGDVSWTATANPTATARRTRTRTATVRSSAFPAA